MLLLHITFDGVINVTYCMEHLVVDYFQSLLLMTPSYQLPVTMPLMPLINKPCSKATLAFLGITIWCCGRTSTATFFDSIKAVDDQFPGELRLCRFAFSLPASLCAFMGLL